MRATPHRITQPTTLLAALLLGPGAFAQTAASPTEIKTMCPSVVASVMVGKVSCTAELCNTGASQGGFAGLLAQAMHRQAIDAASFSNSVGAQLTTALKQTGCFEVVDAAGMEDLRKEMEALGKPPPPPVKVDFVVRASVTKAEYVMDESSFLGYKKRTATSSLGIDTKLVSALRGTVSEAGAYDATLARSSSGLEIPFYSSNSDAAKRGSPFADVAREVVAKAAVGLTTRILSLASAAPPPPQAQVQAQAPADAPAPTQAAEAPASAPQ